MATRKLIQTGSFKLGRQSVKNDLSLLDNKHLTIPDEILTPGLNILELEEWLLPNIIMYLFKTFILSFEYKKISPLALKEFIVDVCDAYLEVPYHNLHHATNVLHITYMLLNKCELYDKLNPDILFATLIAALVHDIGHPGTNNLFEINTFSDLALKYNDMSVLEQYHCALAFDLMKKHNLYSNMNREDFCLVRKTIVACILGTDMAHHKAITELLIKKTTTGFDFKMLDEQILACKLLLHAADIGNPIQTNELCEEWSTLVNQEFHNQAVKETEHGITPTYPLVSSEMSFYSGEMKYIQFVCLPYWEALTNIFPKLVDELEKIYQNLHIFSEKHDALVRKNSEIRLEEYA
jgi:high affinity cGMP-specific 3',5'-cyclic phosphodiesterase 9